MTEVTRLEVLQEARKLAEELGAVENGNHYFEDDQGREVECAAVLHQHETDQVCRVCIAGAVFLAAVRTDYALRRTYEMRRAEEAAYSVLGEEGERLDGSPLVDPIDQRGTPYMLAVLDRMVEREQEKVTA